MSRKKSLDKKSQKIIANNRVQKLFTMAKQAALNHKIGLATRYVEIARKISMKYQMPIPKKYKQCFCKHCYTYLLPNVNSRYRIHGGKLVIYCKKCKKYTRKPIKK